MNLHLTQDNPFIDNFIRNARLFSDTENRYLVFTWSDNEPLKHVKSPEVFSAKWNSTEFWDIIGDVSRYERVYFHYLLPKFNGILKRFSKETKFVWMFWGGDGFGYPSISDRFILPYTKRFLKYSFPNFLSNFKTPVLAYKYMTRPFMVMNWLHLMRRMDYFAHYIYSDYLFLKKELDIKAGFIPFTYGYWKDFVTEEQLTGIDRTRSADILLGNSGSETNNHVDALEVLAGMDIAKNVKIICPLSYSAPGKAYIDFVIGRGRKLFGGRFIPLTDYLPRAEYDRMLNGCGTFFMPHLRSQAFGNIIFALATGAKLLFFEQNNLARLLSEQCFHLTMIGSEAPRPFDFNGLTEEAMLENRRLLDIHFGSSKMMKWYRDLLHIG